MDKKNIRKIMTSKRNALTKEQVKHKSNNIYSNLKRIKEFDEAEQILCYINIKNEVITEKIIEYFQKSNKRVAAPKVLTDEMEFYYFSSDEELIKGYFNIPEPVNITDDNKCIPNKDDIIIIPGLAFDKSGGRVGYGGGFFDKYLSRNKNLIKIAVAYDFQVIDEIIEVSDYDVKPDYIVTDERIIKVLQ